MLGTFMTLYGFQKGMSMATSAFTNIDEDFLKQLLIFNFHSSVLPDFRGPSPIIWQIKLKEKSIVSIIVIVFTYGAISTNIG